MFVISVTNSCHNTNEKRAERMAERIFEKASAGEADVEVDGESLTIKTEDGTMVANTSDKKWPSEIPDEVPEFKYGNVEHVTFRDMTDGKMWTMVVEKVPNDVLDKYQKELKKEGFKTSLVSHYNEEGMLTAENGKMIVAVLAGEGNASISVSVEN